LILWKRITFSDHHVRRPCGRPERVQTTDAANERKLHQLSVSVTPSQCKCQRELAVWSDLTRNLTTRWRPRQKAKQKVSKLQKQWCFGHHCFCRLIMFQSVAVAGCCLNNQF